MNSFRIVFKQTFFQILGKVVTSLSTFLILSVVARTYGKEDLGAFTLSLTYLGVFMMIVDFGFNGHLLRDEQFKKDNETTFKKLLGIRIAMAVVLIACSLVLLPLFSFSGINFITLTIAGSLSIMGSALFVSSNLIFQKNLRYDLSVLATVAGTFSYMLFVLYSSNAKFPLLSLSLSSMFGWMLIGLVALLLLKKLLKDITPVFDWQFSLNLIKKSWLIAATLFLNVIYFRVDSFFITFFKGLEDAGIYNLAYQFFQAALVLPIFIMNSYYPILLKSYSGIKSAITILFAISLFGILLTFLLSPFLIITLAGQGYEGSILSLRILSLGFPAFFISAIFMWMLVAEGKYKLLFALYTSGLIFNLIFNLIFIPQYSYIGAAYVTIASEYVILGLQLFFLRKVIFGKTR